MRHSHNKRTLICLLLLATGGIAGLILTSQSRNSRPSSKSAGPADSDNGPTNPQFLDTARRLTTLVTTADEIPLAQDALREADRELDMQFAAALQATAQAPIPQTQAVQRIQRRLVRTGKSIQDKAEEIQGLQEAMKKARPSQRDGIQAQLDVSQAELNLYKETLEDAQDDLIRAGGDPHSRVQQLVDEHKAASNEVDAIKITPSKPTASAASLVGKFSQWNTLRQKENQIFQAKQDAYSAAAELAKSHDAMQQQVQAEQAKRKAASSPALPPSATGNSASTGNAAVPAPPVDPANALSSIRRLSDDRKALTILGRRIRGLQRLGATYTEWDELVKQGTRMALHAVIASVFWIVVMLLLMFGLNRATEHFFSRLTLDIKQRTTLQAVIRITVQVVTVAVILIVIFGPPNELSTVLGLAGAGLTVVLKDFIVSFLGWFVLMGRHGIHVGDWVEIEGVRGEVVEITLLRTILLETGNWTDAGQPTGRQVGFLNQYAVDGYYFNFSTAGQWLWDELQVLIPRGQNPYPLIEQIRGIVTREIETNTKLADSEWLRVSQRYGVRAFSAEPSINVRQTDTGVVVIVRYVTRALERADVRYRLNHAFVKLLNQGEDTPAPAVVVPAPAENKQP